MTAEHLKKLADAANERKEKERLSRETERDNWTRTEISDHWPRIERELREAAMRNGHYCHRLYSDQYAVSEPDRFCRILEEMLQKRGFDTSIYHRSENPYILINWKGIK